MRSPYGVIYRITCLTTGKCYHGQTVNEKERWAHHLRKDSHCRALRSALTKYGSDNFKFEVVATASSAEDLNFLEVLFVKMSLSPRGYNLLEGGGSRRPSVETRKKISESGKVSQNRPEVKAKNSLGVRQAMAKPEVKERHRTSLKEAAARPGERERKSAFMKEVHARPGEKEKRGKAIKVSWAKYTLEEKEARILKQKEGNTPEVLAKLSAASLAKWSNPEYVAKRAENLKGAYTPEVRARISAASKAAHARPGAKEQRGAAISRAHNTPEGKLKLARRRRSYESMEAWQERLNFLASSS